MIYCISPFVSCMCEGNKLLWAVLQEVFVRFTRGTASAVERWSGEQRRIPQFCFYRSVLPFLQEYAILKPYRIHSQSQEQQRRLIDARFVYPG